MRVKSHCNACGSSKVAAYVTGEVAYIAVEHEADCPFLKALNEGTDELWEATNGDPITTEVERP